MNVPPFELSFSRDKSSEWFTGRVSGSYDGITSSRVLLLHRPNYRPCLLETGGGGGKLCGSCSGFRSKFTDGSSWVVRQRPYVISGEIKLSGETRYDRLTWIDKVTTIVFSKEGGGGGGMNIIYRFGGESSLFFLIFIVRSDIFLSCFVEMTTSRVGECAWLIGLHFTLYFQNRIQVFGIIEGNFRSSSVGKPRGS